MNARAAFPFSFFLFPAVIVVSAIRALHWPGPAIPFRAVFIAICIGTDICIKKTKRQPANVVFPSNGKNLFRFLLVASLELSWKGFLLPWNHTVRVKTNTYFENRSAQDK